MNSLRSELNSITSKSTGDSAKSYFPIVLGAIAILSVIFGLGRIAIINAERRDAEKKRGDALQQGIDALNKQSGENTAFFEIVRKLLITQGEAEKQALLDQLRGFQFSTTTTTTTSTTTPTAKSQSTPTTPTTSRTSVTTAPRPPPSTTTTTSTTQPRPPPQQCIPTPVTLICPPVPTASANGRRS